MRRSASVLLLLAMAGCVAPGAVDPSATPVSEEADPSWAERALPFGDDHDHFDATQHQGLSTSNFEVLGWDPLATEAYGGPAGSTFCGDARETGDGRRLAVVHSFYSDVALIVVDVTDPAAPAKLGEIVLPTEKAYDVALTADGKHALLGLDPKTPQAPAALASGVDLAPLAPRAQFRDACTGELRDAGPLPQGPSTALVSLADPTAPTIVDSFPAPVLGVHSVTANEVDGRQLVTVSVTNLVHAASYYQFFEVKGDKLEILGTYQAPPAPSPEGAPPVNGHVEAYIQKHPVTGQVLAYLADWDAGVILLDITDPLLPRELSRFSAYTGGGGSYMTGVETGNIHEAIPIEGLWDGRHYVLAGQEILGHPEDHPTGWVWILDDTDPTDLKPVGRWTLPVDVEWEMSLQFSTHYLSVVDRTMFVSLYHGGVWAVDLSTPEALAAPRSIGVFLPAHVPADPPEIGGEDVVGTPTVMEQIALPGGDIVVFDGQSGVYVVRFDAMRPAPAPPVWPGSELP